MSKRRILFIDDEPFFAEPYIRELEKCGDVILEETALGAVDSINSAREWDAIVLDIMMPNPEGKKGVTADGLDTGLWILGEIITAIVANSVPVIILTNRNIPRIAEFLDELERRVGFPPELVVVRPKIETPRFLLPRIVQSAIDKFRPPLV